MKKFIITPQSVARQLWRYALLGAGIFVAVRGFDVINNFTKSHKYTHRFQNVERVIEKGDFEKAQSLIGDLFEEPDIKLLEGKLSIAKNEKKKSILNDLIKEENYAGSLKVLAELNEQGILGLEEVQTFSQKIKSLTLENRINTIKSKNGEDKINCIERVLRDYPNYDRVDELRKEIGTTYIKLTGDSLKSYNAKSSEYFERFLKWIVKQENSIISQLDFSQLIELKKEALNVEMEETSHLYDESIEIGDKVRVVQKLGYLANDKDGYLAVGDDGKIEIGTEGIVFSKDNSERCQLGVKFSNGKEQSFTYREVERIDKKFYPIIHVGDNVRVVKKLGYLKNDKDGYLIPGDDGKIEIGTEGIVVSEDASTIPFRVILGYRKQNFAVREIERIEAPSFIGYEEKIIGKLDEIISFYMQKSGRKEE